MGLLAHLPSSAVDGREKTWRAGGGAMRSDDLARIAALPRRTPPSEAEQRAYADAVTSLLRRDNSDCDCRALGSPCITHLLPVQGWYLAEAMAGRGVLGHVVAGGGKTGIDVLLPMVIPNCRRAVVLIPPQLRVQFAHDFERWRQHFRVPNLAGGSGNFVPGRPTLDVLAYSELSVERCATWFKAVRPDAVIFDEADALKDPSSVRTGRVLRHAAEREEEDAAKSSGSSVRFFSHSGSLTSDSVGQYAHLSAITLREGSPLPIEPREVVSWAASLDPGPRGGPPIAAPGALREFCAGGESARSGFRRRLCDTAGVVVTEDARLGIPLRIRERKVTVPAKILEAMKRTKRLLVRPDEAELIDDLEVSACLRQLACGFFYRWKFPRGEPEALIDEWYARRRAWHKELTDALEHRRDGLDSPGLLKAAAQRGEWKSWAWAPWAEVEKQVIPEQEAVWLDDFLVRDALAWARAAVGVVWSGFTALAGALSALPVYEGGERASREIAEERGDRSILASIDAHGTGKNLQRFSRGLVMVPPANGGEWEQVLARHHRHGQEAGEVVFDVYRHTAEFRQSIDSARGDAKYVHETTGKLDRLCYAQFDFSGI